MAVSGSTSAGMNVHDLAILLKRIPDEADYPLVFAANSLQAFNVCGFVLSSYLKWVDYQTGNRTTNGRTIYNAIITSPLRST